MKQQAHLSWNNFRRSVFVRGEQRVHRVSVSPAIDVFGDGIGGRVGIWIETAADTALPDDLNRLTSIRAAIVAREGGTFVEVATANETIFRQFYLFATSVSESVLQRQLAPLDAIAAELQCFDELLQVRSVLSTERQIGLIGELLFLERLIEVHGTDAFRAWLGPFGELHDFRLNIREFEVKTTTSARRIHTINGENQLVPSQGHTLYVVSILLGPGGLNGGASLDEIVRRLASRVENSANLQATFEDSLRASGFEEKDRANYNRRFVLRKPIALVQITATFPALTRPRITAGVGPESNRIEHVCYDVNIEGLECEDGDPMFAAAILTSAKQP